jgi:hypothetical protein
MRSQRDGPPRTCAARDSSAAARHSTRNAFVPSASNECTRKAANTIAQTAGGPSGAASEAEPSKRAAPVAYCSGRPASAARTPAAAAAAENFAPDQFFRGKINFSRSRRVAPRQISGFSLIPIVYDIVACSNLQGRRVDFYDERKFNRRLRKSFLGQVLGSIPSFRHFF